jgi:hypothetical protein
VARRCYAGIDGYDKAFADSQFAATAPALFRSTCSINSMREPSLTVSGLCILPYDVGRTRVCGKADKASSSDKGNG